MSAIKQELAKNCELRLKEYGLDPKQYTVEFFENVFAIKQNNSSVKQVHLYSNTVH